MEALSTQSIPQERTGLHGHGRVRLRPRRHLGPGQMHCQRWREIPERLSCMQWRCFGARSVMPQRAIVRAGPEPQLRSVGTHATHSPMDACLLTAVVPPEDWRLKSGNLLLVLPISLPCSQQTVPRPFQRAEPMARRPAHLRRTASFSVCAAR